MQVAYKILADLVVLIHLAWILFLIFGAVMGYRIRWIRWLHLAGLGFSVVLQIFSTICPLTHLEVWLRERYDPSLAYPGAFIAYYAEKLVYLEVDSVLLFWLTLGVVLTNVTIYGLAIRRSLQGQG